MGGCFAQVEIQRRKRQKTVKRATVRKSGSAKRRAAKTAVQKSRSRRPDSKEKTGCSAEQRLQQILDLAALGIAHISPDGKWLHANSTLCEILGYSREELLSASFMDITHPDDRAGDLRQFHQLLHGEVQTTTMEKRVVRKDGFNVWVNSTLSAMRGPSGKVLYFIVVIEDITGRKRMEDTLMLLRTAVESLPLGVTITNLDGKIIFVNRAEAQMHGYSVDELLGRDVRILAPEDQWSGMTVRDLIERNLVSESPFMREARNVRRDGTIFPVVISSMPVRDMRGTPLGHISVSQDITERKKIIDALIESEQKYRTLFDSAGDAIFIMDYETGVLTDCNARACELLRMTRNEIVGMHRSRLHPVEDVEQYEVMFRLLSDDRRTALFYDKTVVNRYGTAIWVDISATLFEIQGKKFVMGIFRDATDRRASENAVYQAKQDWEDTFNTITDMITIHDKDFTIIRSNKAAEKLLGLPRLETSEAKCYRFYHGAGCPPSGCPSCESLRTAKPSVHEFFEPHLGMYLEIRAIPRLDKYGRLVGLIHVARDITDRKKSEEERQALEARLREAEKMETIGSLAGGVAHEVRNPLNAIMALTDALDREVGENSEHRLYLQHMRTQVDRLSTLMNELLDLGKPVEKSHLREESLSEICALSIDAWKQSKWGRGRDAELIVAAEEQEMKVSADAKKLQQVFINLLDNAVQHSPDDTVVRIEIVPGNGNTVQARVVDKGSGIPEDILPRVFETFFTTRRGGTGLGLSIVKHIVEMHEGAVTLSNNVPPPGLTATVILPICGESIS